MSHLSGRQTRAIEALLVERDHTAAAAACHVSRRTLARWLDDPDFRSAYYHASNARLWDCIGQLRTAAGDALATLRAAMGSDTESVRVRAAIAVLDLAVKTDNDILAQRLDALEEQNKLMTEHETRPATART